MGGFSNPSAVNPYTDAEAIAAIRADSETLAALFKGGNILHIPTVAGWTSALVGTGSVYRKIISDQIVRTGATAASSALLYAVLSGFGLEATALANYNFDPKTYLLFNYARVSANANIVARFQLKQSAAIGALGTKGIGIKALNFALWGESFGTELGEVDLGVTLTDNREKQIYIVLDPGVSVKWYVNDVLKGTQSTAAAIPTGYGNETYLVHSILSGDPGADCYSALFYPKIWQAR